MSSDLYDVEFEDGPDGLAMSFRKNAYRVDRQRARMGKTIIVTDNRDLSMALEVSPDVAR